MDDPGLNAGVRWYRGLAEDFSPTIIQVLGVVEVLGALGLTLQSLTGIARPSPRSPQPDSSGQTVRRI